MRRRRRLDVRGAMAGVVSAGAVSAVAVVGDQTSHLLGRRQQGPGFGLG